MEFIAVIFIYLLNRQVQGADECETMSKDNLSTWEADFIPEHYDRLLAPRIKGRRTPIFVNIFPMGIPDMNVEKMTLDVDFYIMLGWNDCRLSMPPEAADPQVQIAVPLKLSEKIWTPSAIIANGVGTKPLKFYSNLQEMKIILGQLSFYSRHHVSFYCKYDLSAYPMDKQYCELHIIPEKDQTIVEVVHGTYPFDAKAVKERAPPQCIVTSVLKGNCTSSDKFTSGTSCVALQIVLERALPFYLIVTYVPSCLIVILSWVSFWLDIDASAPRVTLGLTSLLTLSTQFANVQKSLPPVSYVKAVDVWMFACMFMVFASLIQFAVVNFQFRRNKSKQEDKKISKINTLDNSSDKPKVTFTNKVYVFQVGDKGEKAFDSPKSKFFPRIEDKNKNDKKDNGMKSRSIDTISRILFPLIFLIFNIIYWSYYLTFYN